MLEACVPQFGYFTTRNRKSSRCWSRSVHMYQRSINEGKVRLTMHVRVTDTLWYNTFPIFWATYATRNSWDWCDCVVSVFSYVDSHCCVCVVSSVVWAYYYPFFFSSLLFTLTFVDDFILFICKW